MGFALVIGLGDISYPYDELLKVFICVIGVLGAYSSYKDKRFKWVWILGGVALLFNPFLKAHFGEDGDVVWSMLSRITGFILIIYFFRNTKATEMLKKIRDVKRKWKIRISIVLCLLALFFVGMGARGVLVKYFYESDLLEHGSPWQIKLAIKAGADINGKFYSETYFITPLIRAATYNKNPAVIKELLNLGAEINAFATNPFSQWGRMRDGATAMEFAAAQNSNPEIIKILAQAGASIGKRNIVTEKEFFSDTIRPGPLMYAAEYNANPEVIKILIQLGADINKQDSAGLTPLMYAAGSQEFGDQRSKIIRLLVESGADIKLRDHKNRTAFDYLEKNPEARENKDFAQLEKLLKPNEKEQPAIAG
jgi:ankyrin repeat protein